MNLALNLLKTLLVLSKQFISVAFPFSAVCVVVSSFKKPPGNVVGVEVSRLHVLCVSVL